MNTRYRERIFLTGPMGSGKSALALRLAALLEWDAVDTDAEITRVTGKTPQELFAAEGEPRFREVESAVLAQVMTRQRIVVATGGGIVERAANRALMAEHGWVVSLTVTPETAWQRIAASAQAHGTTAAAMRPMLLAGDDPLARLRTLNARRQQWYAAADERLTADGADLDELAQQVIAGLVVRGLLAPEGAQPQSQHLRAGAHEYEAVVAWGSVSSLGERLRAFGLPPRLHLVADAAVARLYAPLLTAQLSQAGFAPEVCVIPQGESSKSAEQLFVIYDWLAERRAERQEAIVALGGGVIGDLAGFAAATYLRGVPLIQVPTSSLAQVDASIGGKTAINHTRGKNLIGAFYPPLLVVADPAVLLTQEVRERRSGWAEVVKHGVALDRATFELVERRADDVLAMQPQAVTQVVAHSVAVKAGVVQSDEREAEGGMRALLNYGHTTGHAIEKITGYGTMLHGEAVAIGMSVAARLGQRLGITPASVVARQEALLVRLGLPVRAEGLAVAAIMRAALWDKKVRGAQVRWIVPTELGQARLVTGVADEDVCAALLDVGAVAGTIE